MAEYTARLDTIAFELEKLESGDFQMSAGSATLDDAREVSNAAISGPEDFRDELKALSAPEELVDLPTDLIEVQARIIAAREALTARAETAIGPVELDETTEARACRWIASEPVSVCEFLVPVDATAARDVLADVPSIPADMKEAVEVAFGC